MEIPEYKYVSAIVERKGTGENWQLHILSWKDYFKECFSYSDFSLLPTGIYIFYFLFLFYYLLFKIIIIFLFFSIFLFYYYHFANFKKNFIVIILF